MQIREDRLELLMNDSVQGFTEYLGVVPVSLKPGIFVTRLKLENHHSQKTGFAHAGVIATIADHSAGYACYSLVAENQHVLTIEYKINFLKPAIGDLLECRARVLKPGKQILFTEAEVYVINDNVETLVAKAMHTMVSLPKDEIVSTQEPP